MQICYAHLHPIEGGSLPHKLNTETMRLVDWRPIAISQLQRNLLAVLLVNYMTQTAPLFEPVIEAELELVSRQHAHLPLVLREHEVHNSLFVQTHIPMHNEILFRVGLFHLLVVVCLIFDQRAVDVLVHVRVPVFQQNLWRHIKQ